MVTVFRIVIYFPRHDIEYFQFDIVDSASRRPTNREPPRQIELPPNTEAFERAVGVGEARSVAEDWLPPIQLPTVAFADLELLRARQGSLEIRKRYDELFQEPRQDTWSRLGRGLDSLGNALSEVLHGDEDDRPPVIELTAPAPGLTAHLEWGAPPLDRQCLLSQGLGQSWRLASVQLSGPVSILVKVNRLGKVTLVQEQPDDGQGFIEAMTKALLGFRFEPLASSAPPSQYGTVIIRPEQGRSR
jgi:hypothetical protein